MKGNNPAGKAIETRIPWHERLLTRTIVSLILPCILPLLLVCGWIIYYVGVEAQQKAESALLIDATEASRKAGDYFTALENNITFVATHLDHDNLTSKENARLVTAFAVTHHDIQTVWLTGNSGEVSVLYDQQEMLTRKRLNLSVPPLSDGAGVNVTWHGTSYNDFGEPLITCTAPIKHPWNTRPYGTLTFEIQPRDLQKIAAEIDVGKTGMAFLVDKDGQLISHSKRSIPVAGHDLSSHPALRWLQEADAGQSSSHLAHYQTTIIAYRKIPVTEWGVVIQKEESEVYQMRNQLIRLILVSFAGLILLIIPLAMIFSLRLTRPISALLAAIRKLAAGELTSQINLSCPGEIGMLGSAFSEMATQRLQSEKRYREIVDSTDNLISRVDAEGRFVFVNHVGEKILGVSLPQLLGRQAFQFIHPDDRERTEKWFTSCIEKQLEQSTIENRQISINGGLISHFLWTNRFFYDDNGKCIGVNGIGHNITERKQAEEEKAKLEAQLQQAQKLESVGRLAGGVAHDFNNMLGVILGYTEMAMEQVDPAQPLHASLEQIRKAARHSADLTKQLLAFARKQPIAPNVLDLNETVTSTLKMLQLLLGENIHLNWQPKAELWPIKIDPSQVDQILANLCVNARDAITDVGTITIETENNTLDETFRSEHQGSVPGEFVRLAVSDNGCGMDKETLSHIFEPFFTTKRVGEGTGLGLAMVYGIVKQNNGFIYADSEPGSGTTFTIYLPRHTGKVEQKRPADAAAPARRGQETILLVEDEPDILEMTAMMHEKEGYTVLAANTPGEAIRLAREYPGEIHLLMTDVIMPEMNGRELADRISATRPAMKCLFMSGYTADIISSKGVLAKGVRFIQKPFSKKGLSAKVREVLDSKALIE